MAKKANGGITTVVPSNSQLSYVLSITVPQPTIRIRIPRMLARMMQRITHDDYESVENGSSRKYKSRNNMVRKVGSIFSVFRSKKSEIADCSDGENGELEGKDDDDDDQKNNKLKGIEGNEIERVKTTRKRSENDLEERVVATGFGVSRSICLKDDEGNEQKPKGKAKKSVRFKTDENLEKVASGDEVAEDDGSVNNKTSLSILVAGERRRPRSVRTRSRNVSVKQELPKNDNIPKAPSKPATNIQDINDLKVASEPAMNAQEIPNKDDIPKFIFKPATNPQEMPNEDDIPKFASKPATNLHLKPNPKPNPHRKLKVARTVKKILGIEQRQELCKKRILMGEKCRPLGIIEYDENGILLPEPIP